MQSGRLSAYDTDRLGPRSRRRSASMAARPSGLVSPASCRRRRRRSPARTTVVAAINAAAHATVATAAAAAAAAATHSAVSPRRDVEDEEGPGMLDWQPLCGAFRFCLSECVGVGVEKGEIENDWNMAGGAFDQFSIEMGHVFLNTYRIWGASRLKRASLCLVD